MLIQLNGVENDNNTNYKKKKNQNKIQSQTV